jgi:hypothetical protein
MKLISPRNHSRTVTGHLLTEQGFLFEIDGLVSMVCHSILILSTQPLSWFCLFLLFGMTQHMRVLLASSVILSICQAYSAPIWSRRTQLMRHCQCQVAVTRWSEHRSDLLPTTDPSFYGVPSSSAIPLILPSHVFPFYCLLDFAPDVCILVFPYVHVGQLGIL